MHVKVIKNGLCALVLGFGLTVAAKDTNPFNSDDSNNFISPDKNNRGGQSGQYSLRKTVIASGGYTTGAGYRLTSAIGQGTTGQSTSPSYQLTSGFYQPNRDLIFFNEFEINP